MPKTRVLLIALLTLPLTATFGAQFQDSPAPVDSRLARQDLVKMPVFLFCPHKESAGSWSLYVIADRNDPSKALAVGLEELMGKNSKELTYRGVLAAQKDPTCPRKRIAQLNYRDFANDIIQVKENNMLSIKVGEVADGLSLIIDARISLDDRFVVGGSQQQRRNIMLQYNPQAGTWLTKATKLENQTGQNVVGNTGMTLTGIVFTAGATSISRICAVDPAGRATILLDR